MFLNKPALDGSRGLNSVINFMLISKEERFPLLGPQMGLIT